MRYPFFELLEEAHNHGRDCKGLWGQAKSLSEFLKQYNLIKEFSQWKDKKFHREAAPSLRGKGYTIREIAKMLGYKNPGSVTNLLNPQKPKH